jgi:hypothetical protein
MPNRLRVGKGLRTYALRHSTGEKSVEAASSQWDTHSADSALARLHPRVELDANPLPSGSRLATQGVHPACTPAFHHTSSTTGSSVHSRGSSTSSPTEDTFATRRSGVRVPLAPPAIIAKFESFYLVDGSFLVPFAPGDQRGLEPPLLTYNAHVMVRSILTESQ